MEHILTERRRMADKRTTKKMGRPVRYGNKTNECTFLLDDASTQVIAEEAARLSCSRSDALVELLRLVRRCRKQER